MSNTTKDYISVSSDMPPAATALRNIRIDLAGKYPGIDFQIGHVDFGIRVAWTDGPSEESVNAVTAKYETGGDLPTTWQLVHGWVDTVFGARGTSANLGRHINAALVVSLAAGVFSDEPCDVYGTLGQLAFWAFSATDFPPGDPGVDYHVAGVEVLAPEDSEDAPLRERVQVEWILDRADGIGVMVAAENLILEKTPDPPFFGSILAVRHALFRRHGRIY